MASSKSKKRGGSKGAAASGKPAPSSSNKYASAKPSKKPAAPAAPAPPMEGMSTAEKIVWISLHALVFLVPLAISNANWIPKIAPSLSVFQLPLTYDQFDIVKVFVMRACALVGIGAWAFDFFMRGGKLRRTKADWVILIFLGWVLLTSLTSIHIPTAFFGKYRRFEGFWSFLTYAVVYFLTVQAADRPSRIRSLAHTLVVSGAIVAGYGLMQYLGVDPISWVGANQRLPFEFNRGFATYGNPDLFGGFLMFPLPISLAMALSEKRVGWRAVYWAVFLIMVAAWITSFVRGAWIGGAFSLAIVGITAAFAPAAWGAVDWGAIGSVGAISGAIVARSLTEKSDVLNVWSRLTSIFKFGEGSARTRFEIWEAAVNAIKQRPIFGWGPDTFRLVFPATKPLAYTRDAGYISVADNVHNYPLQLASAIGIPGALLMYGLFGWVLYLGVPNAFARGKGPERLLITGVWAAAAGYILHLMFGLSVTGSTVLLWLALAIIVAPTARTLEVGAKAWGPVVAVTIAAVVTAASIYNVAYITADRYYLKSLFAQGMGENAVETAMMSIRLNPSNDMYRSQLAEAYRLQMMGWIQEAQSLQMRNEDPTEALQQAQATFALCEQAYMDVIEFVPTEYDNHVFLTAVYNQVAPYFGEVYYEKAIAAADRGISVERYGPLVRYQKALALWNLGRTDEAINVLEGVVDMDPNYLDPITLLAQAYESTGRTEKAIEYYLRAVKIGATPSQTAMRQLVALYSAKGDYRSALKWQYGLVDLNPGDAEIEAERAAIEASLAIAGGSDK